MLGSAAEGHRQQHIEAQNARDAAARIHGFFTQGQLILRMAAELGMVAFKLERLALKLKSYLC